MLVQKKYLQSSTSENFWHVASHGEISDLMRATRFLDQVSTGHFAVVT